MPLTDLNIPQMLVLKRKGCNFKISSQFHKSEIFILNVFSLFKKLYVSDKAGGAMSNVK